MYLRGTERTLNTTIIFETNALTTPAPHIHSQRDYPGDEKGLGQDCVVSPDRLGLSLAEILVPWCDTGEVG